VIYPKNSHIGSPSFPSLLTSLVAASKILIKEMGPEAVPDEVLTIDPEGLNLEKANPVPPRFCGLWLDI